MLKVKIYYYLKPLVPRYMQIIFRRYFIQRKRKQCTNIWPINETAAATPPGWSGWPGNKKFAFVLMHDVDTKKGHQAVPNLMRLEEEIGFKSSFNFCPKRYHVSVELRRSITKRGFEVGVHGLKHDGKLYMSRKIFMKRAVKINDYLRDWNSVGFSSPSMHCNLKWNHDLNIEYDISTFDTDPFEPYPGGVKTSFPFWVSKDSTQDGYVELPYTIPQDFTVYVLMKEKTIDIWKKKIDWIAQHGGMVLLNTHPDYINFGKSKCAIDKYPMEFYEEFLDYVKSRYKGQYWNPLPMEMARFWRESMVKKGLGNNLNSVHVKSSKSSVQSALL